MYVITKVSISKKIFYNFLFLSSTTSPIYQLQTQKKQDHSCCNHSTFKMTDYAKRPEITVETMVSQNPILCLRTFHNPVWMLLVQRRIQFQNSGRAWHRKSINLLCFAVYDGVDSWNWQSFSRKRSEKLHNFVEAKSLGICNLLSSTKNNAISDEAKQDRFIQ